MVVVAVVAVGVAVVVAVSVVLVLTRLSYAAVAQVRQAAALNNYARFFTLYKSAPNLSARVMDFSLHDIRLNALATMGKAYVLLTPSMLRAACCGVTLLHCCVALCAGIDRRWTSTLCASAWRSPTLSVVASS